MHLQLHPWAYAGKGRDRSSVAIAATRAKIMFNAAATRNGTKKPPTQLRAESVAIKECEKAFKRQDLALAEKQLSLVQDPASIRILYQPEWDRHCLNPRHFTLLHLAAGNGWTTICKVLVKVFNCRPNATDDMGFYTPLHFAIGGKHREVVEYLLEEENCDPHCLRFTVTPLQLACTIGNALIVDYLLSVWKSNPNVIDDFCNTPLHHAVSKGHLEVVLSLFATGEIRSMHCNKDGDTSLHLAARLGHYQIFVCILSHVEVCMTQCRNNIGDTPLHEAARNGHTKIIKYILQTEGVEDVHVTNALGNTPLHEASLHNHTDIIKLLLYQTADKCLLLHNTQGNTPLHLACKKGNLSTAHLLIIKGFNIHAKNHDNQSPLDVAMPIAQGQLLQTDQDTQK